MTDETMPDRDGVLPFDLDPLEGGLHDAADPLPGLAGHRGRELNPAGCRDEASVIVCAEVGGQALLVPAIRGL